MAESKIRQTEFNQIGSKVNITGYTADNPYICPSEGYVNAVSNNANSQAAIYVITSGGTIPTQVLGTAGDIVIYVKKGFKVYGRGENNGFVNFYPFY